MAPSLRVPSVKPSMAWLFLFFPVLSYYVTTRLHSMGLFRSSTYGTVVDTKLSGIAPCGSDDDLLLYLTHECNRLKYPVYLVDDGFQDVVATAWKHDEELGRGYLLLSTSFHRGKVWQWETGGGPIAIGRTLHLQDSGCRSNFYRNCTGGDGNSNSNLNSNLGSGGMIVDTWHDPPRLIVAEWGEGRIVRLEENGARTPMVIQLPEMLSNFPARVQNPFKLLLSPLGDLMILDTFGSEDCLLRLPQAATGTPALGSLAASRRAHSWESVNTTRLPQLLLQSTHLGGIALEPHQWLQMYATMKQNDRVVLVRLSLEDDEEENSGQQPRQSTIVLDYTAHSSEPQAIEVDEKGNLYLVVDDGILLAAPSGKVLGKVTISDGPIVDLTLGEDNFLYMATSTKLMRTRVRNGRLTIPTDLLLKV
jgi:hypothetical protein